MGLAALVAFLPRLIGATGDDASPFSHVKGYLLLPAALFAVERALSGAGVATPVGAGSGASPG